MREPIEAPRDQTTSRSSLGKPLTAMQLASAPGPVAYRPDPELYAPVYGGRPGGPKRRAARKRERRNRRG